MKTLAPMTFVAFVSISIIVGMTFLAPDVPYFSFIIIGITTSAIITFVIIARTEK